MVVTSWRVFQRGLLVAGLAACGGSTQSTPTPAAGTADDAGAPDAQANPPDAPADGEFDGSVCPLPSSPTMAAVGLPSESGCYAGGGNGTWIRVLCLCEMLLTNPSTSGKYLTFTLALGASDPIPTLAAGPTRVTVSLEDPDSAFHDSWTSQEGNGTAFALSRQASQTTVTMGARAVSFAAAPLAPCARLWPQAQVSDVTTTLTMTATITDASGQLVTQTDGTCHGIPHPTIALSAEGDLAPNSGR